MAVLFACGIPARQIVTYHAVIERVTEFPGEAFSPAKGHRPLRYLYLRVTSPGERSSELKVEVLDFYSPRVHGREGDRVVFCYPGDLPVRADVDFDSLGGYRLMGDLTCP